MVQRVMLCRDQVELIKAGVLEAWTSGVEAQWWREGFIESHRIDIVVGMDLQNKRRALPLADSRNLCYSTNTNC